MYNFPVLYPIPISISISIYIYVYHLSHCYTPYIPLDFSKRPLRLRFPHRGKAACDSRSRSCQ